MAITTYQHKVMVKGEYILTDLTETELRDHLSKSEADADLVIKILADSRVPQFSIYNVKAWRLDIYSLSGSRDTSWPPKDNLMAYNVFVRNWWQENSDWPGGLEPDAGARKSYLKYGLSEDDARAMAKEYNATHKPGRLSRKAEFEDDGADREYNGYPNYATWNVPLWIDNEQILYLTRLKYIKNDIGLAEDDGPVAGDDVKRFVNTYMGGKTPDLSKREMKDVRWDYIADHWEDERLEMQLERSS